MNKITPNSDRKNSKCFQKKSYESIEENKVIAMVPVRAGSNRVPNKNTRSFGDTSLLELKLILLERINGLAQIIVSTDCKKILSYEKVYKNVTFLKRPAYLSKNNSSSFDVLKHIFRKIKYKGNVILLQPTSPLRKDQDILNVSKLLSEGRSPIMSVCKAPHSSDLMTHKNKNHKFKPLNNKKLDVFYPNGAIYAANTRWINKNLSFYSNQTFLYFMSEKDSIDIDYEHQFVTAEALFKK